MSGIVALRRSAGCIWKPDHGEVVPAHSESELQALVAGWFDYGQTAQVFSQSVEGRTASVTSLGDDGWLLRVRDASMCRHGWDFSRTVTRAPVGSSRWYMPSERSDLRGMILLDVDIQYAPRQVASPAWAWLAGEPLPDGFQVGKEAYDHIAVATPTDAFAHISVIGRSPWTAEETASVLDTCESLEIDSVVLRGPHSIIVRVADTDQRVYFSRRRDENGVRVSGLVDELGRTYTMKLPSREIIRVSRRRSDS